MKKIAIPTKNDSVDDHFGHCEAYTIYSVDAEKNIINKEILPAPKGCGCKSNIASVLKELDVTLMLAGNMGNGALNVLNNNNIQVIRGCSGDTQQLIENYLQGKLNDSGLSCDHNHTDGHECSH